MPKLWMDESGDDEPGVLEEARCDPMRIFEPRREDPFAFLFLEPVTDPAPAGGRPDLSGTACPGCGEADRCPCCQKCQVCFSCPCNEGF